MRGIAGEVIGLLGRAAAGKGEPLEGKIGCSLLLAWRDFEESWACGWAWPFSVLCEVLHRFLFPCGGVRKGRISFLFVACVSFSVWL